jgi:hypothetical protein
MFQSHSPSTFDEQNVRLAVYSGHASTSTFTHIHLRPWTVGGRVVSDGTYFVHSDIDIEFTLVQDGFGFGGSTEA